MNQFFISYVISGLVFAVVDGIWLSFVANSFYRSQIGSLLLDKPNLPAAVAFYAVFLVGLVVFVITPSLEAGSIKMAAVLGALFGLVTYATYDLTNLATLKNYSLTMTIVDIIWGIVLSASVSVLTVILIQKFIAS